MVSNYHPPDEPRVSDHAVIRYLERSSGLSFDHVRAEILTPEVVAAMRAGAKRIKVNGLIYVINGLTIVTVLGPKDEHYTR